jgi:hypothetical protein
MGVLYAGRREPYRFSVGQAKSNMAEIEQEFAV